MTPQLDHTEETPKLSNPREYRIFLQQGNDIINNGTRFASIECLREDFPEAAILPAEETPDNWEDLCVQDNALAPAAAEIVAAREAAKKEAHNADMEQQRKAAYQSESDPLFMKYQREESTKEEWLEKIEEIKQRYPKID